MKRYQDLTGDGGSNVLEQIVDIRRRISARFSKIKQIVAIASPKGGVGKSTVTTLVALSAQVSGLKVAILDADFNGSSQGILNGLADAPLVPGQDGILVPHAQSGVGVIALSSFAKGQEIIDFQSVSQGESHTWRQTKEFSILADLIAGTDFGQLDLLLIDLPPGAERTIQYADFFGEKLEIILVTTPSNLAGEIVARGADLLIEGERDVLGILQNMDGYLCKGCGEVGELFSPPDRLKLELPFLGSLPFSPELSSIGNSGLRWHSVPAAVQNTLGEIVKRILATRSKQVKEGQLYLEM